MSSAPSRSVRIVIGALLALATLAAYGDITSHQFILLDDPQYILENPVVRGGLTTEGLRSAFTSGYAANWHPLTWISHMIDVQLFGLDAGGHHAVSLALHCANALLLLAVLDRMTRAFWRSAIVAALFALHPLHVESVAWAAERKDVLSTFFMMWTLLAYARFVERPGLARHLVVLCVFALGLMSKPMLVTLPFVLLLLDVWPLGRSSAADAGTSARSEIDWKRLALLVREKVPLLFMSLAASIVTFFVQRAGGAIESVEKLPIGARAGNALAAYFSYAGKMAWPADLSLHYPLTLGPGALVSLAALAGLLSITWIAWRQRAQRGYLLVGWLWYVGTLVPVIGLVQVGRQSMADRYTYIPLIGLFIALVWLAGDAILAVRPARVRWIAAMTTVPILIALGIATHAQSRYWHDKVSIFAHAVEATPDNVLAEQCLGNALIAEGRMDEGIQHLNEALRVFPDFIEAHNMLGSALGSQGRLEEAVSHLRASLALDAQQPEPLYNLGFALYRLEKIDEAIVELEAVLRLDPSHAAAHQKLGLALCAKEQYASALEHLAIALRARPRDVETRLATARALIATGRVEDALRDHGEVLHKDAEVLEAALKAGENAIVMARQAGDELAAQRLQHQIDALRAGTTTSPH